jgi:hypothetical protein
MFRLLFAGLLFGCSTYEVNVPPSSGNEFGTIERECLAFNSYECPGVVLKSGSVDGSQVVARLIHGIRKPLPAFDFPGSDWNWNVLARPPLEGATVLEVLPGESFTLEWSPDPLWFKDNRALPGKKPAASPNSDNDIYVVLVARSTEGIDAGTDGYDPVWSIYSVGTVPRNIRDSPYELRPIPSTISGPGLWTVIKFFSPAAGFDAAVDASGGNSDAGR